MLHKTRGIVLNYIKYKETSIIAKIYTQQFGMQSYIINGVRSQRSKKGLALLQPLTILDMVVYHKQGRGDGLQRISEYKPTLTFTSIPFEIKKSSMALFITELLSKITKEEEQQGSMFEFLFKVIQCLDTQKSEYESLHIYLMVHLTHYIGFGIHSLEELENDTVIAHVNTDLKKLYLLLVGLYQCSIEHSMIADSRLRSDCLNYMVCFYTQHVVGFKEMKSLEILNQIFR
ncbi:MAG: DNA repair protein RecO [Reichenbachiella sp.]